MTLKYVESHYFSELRNWHQKTESIVKHRIFDRHLTKILFLDGKEERLSAGAKYSQGVRPPASLRQRCCHPPNHSSMSKRPPETLAKLAKPAHPPKTQSRAVSE